MSEPVIAHTTRFTLSEGSFAKPESHGMPYRYDRLLSIRGSYMDVCRALASMDLLHTEQSGFADKPGCTKTRLHPIVDDGQEISTDIRISIHVESPTSAKVASYTSCCDRAAYSLRERLIHNGATCEPLGRQVD